MFIHSIVPAELIEDAYEPPEMKCVKCEYGFLELNHQADGGWAVNRLISTNPADYLNPTYNPGSKYNQQLMN